MTPKTQKFRENFDIFAEKIWKNRLIFKKFQPQYSDLGQKTADFGKKFPAKKKRWVGRARKTGFSFLVALLPKTS